MKRYVEQLKEKPVHVRRNVALGLSGAVTGLVALLWMATMAATGAFSLSPSPGTVASDPGAAQFSETDSNFSELLGAVGESFGGASAEPELTIVDGNTTSTLTPPPSNATDATVIPF